MVTSILSIMTAVSGLHSFIFQSEQTKNPKCALHAYISLGMLLETKHLIVQVPSFMGWCQAVLHDTQ